MAQLIIEDVDEALAERLERQAERERARRSPKLTNLLARALDREEQFERVTREIGEKLKGVGLDSTQLIREDRDR